MKKFIYPVILSIILLCSCSVNNFTGSITAQNSSNIDAYNVKVGNVFIGFVGKGQTTTVYFYTAQNDVFITATGFSAPSQARGTIDLKLNYQYSLNLELNNSRYVFDCLGSPVGSDTNNLSVNDYVYME